MTGANKYREALSELKRAKETLYPLVTMYDSTGLSDEAAITLQDIEPIFEELVDRATPKRVVNRHQGWFQEDNRGGPKWAYCPECNAEHQDGTAFCHRCGQALDWSDDAN